MFQEAAEVQRVTIGYGAAAPATEMPTDQGKCAVAVYDYQAGAFQVTKIFLTSSYLWEALHAC